MLDGAAAAFRKALNPARKARRDWRGAANRTKK
jgi:hypothetical protein